MKNHTTPSFVYSGRSLRGFNLIFAIVFAGAFGIFATSAFGQLSIQSEITVKNEVPKRKGTSRVARKPTGQNGTNRRRRPGSGRPTGNGKYEASANSTKRKATPSRGKIITKHKTTSSVWEHSNIPPSVRRKR